MEKLFGTLSGDNILPMTIIFPYPIPFIVSVLCSKTLHNDDDGADDDDDDNTIKRTMGIENC